MGNNAENSALHHRSKLHFKIFIKMLKNCVFVFHNISVFTVFLIE